MKSDIVGWVDGINRDRLSGWVLQRSMPQRRLAVELIGGTGLKLSVLADRYRADVHQAGLGDGHYGFSIPTRRLAGQTSIRVVTTQPQIVLGRVDLSAPVLDLAVPGFFQCASYSLKIDQPISGSLLTGWAFSQSEGYRRHILSLRVGENIVERRRATLYRRELVNEHCDGYHGFAFPLPERPTRSVALEDGETGLMLILPP